MLSTRPTLPARALRAHALKNCLAIVCAVNRLVESEVGEVTQERLSRSQNAVRRMIALIEEDLLPDSNCCQRNEVEFVSAERVLDAVRGRVEDLAESRQVHVHFRAGAGGVCGDARDLVEALGNIVMNAIQSTPSDGAVVVTSCESADGGQLWTVRDTGPGISRDVLPRIGTPFFSRRKGGSGLGLAVARDVVERHGGRAHIESAPGSGTLVSIRLPPVARA